MTVFLVSYDLRQPGRNYQPLWDLLGTKWRMQRVTESQWLGVLQGSATAIRDAIRAVLDANDRILVLEVKSGAGWAAINGLPGGIDVLRAHVLA